MKASRRTNMRAAERRKLGRLIERYIREHGGEPGRWTKRRDGLYLDGAVLPTAAGPLHVAFDEGVGLTYVFGRFEDVGRARSLLPHRFGVDRLNPFSGKWNFYFDRTWTAATAFARWTAELDFAGLVVTNVSGNVLEAQP